MTQVDHRYHNILRIRICGICIRDNSILLVNHTSLNKENKLWMPPGGGLEFSETIEQCLQREFLEETGYKIAKSSFFCIHEHIAPPLHAIEHFYEVSIIGGNLITGIDPEISKQIIKEVKWVPLHELSQFPEGLKHPVLHQLNKAR